MSITELVYFHSNRAGIYGTYRGAIAFVVLFLGLLIHTLLINKKGDLISIIAVIALCSLVLCSAVGVQLPKNVGQAALYGLLVGLVTSVVYVCMTYLSTNQFPDDIAIIVLLPLLVCLSAIVTYYVSSSLNLYKI